MHVLIDAENSLLASDIGFMISTIIVLRTVWARSGDFEVCIFFSLPVDKQASVNLDYSSKEPRIFQNSHAATKLGLRTCSWIAFRFLKHRCSLSWSWRKFVDFAWIT